MGRLKCLPVAAVVAVAVGMGAAGPAAAAKGNDASAALCQRGGYMNLYNARTGLRFTDEVACVSYGLKGNPYSSLVVATNRYRCGGACWGSVSGFGLKPGAAVRAVAGTGNLPNAALVGTRGAVSGLLGLACGSGWSGVYATSTTLAGAPIKSNTVDSPCG
jgi:hypothetical protein